MHGDAKTFQTTCRNSKALARKNIFCPILISNNRIKCNRGSTAHMPAPPCWLHKKPTLQLLLLPPPCAAIACRPPTTSNLADRHRRHQNRSQLQRRHQGSRQHKLDVLCSSRLCRGQGQRQATIGWRRRGHQQKQTVSIINAMPYGHIIHIINHHAAQGRRRQAVHAGSFPQNRNIHFAPAM